ncbi:MAG: SusD/RagB family nutrient-binding outer membrane lipoprotein [Bacteroidota bacterium]
MKIYKVALLTFLLAFLFSCSQDFLDVNLDPNVAVEGELPLLLTAAQVNIGGEFSTGLGFGGAVYARQLYELVTSTYAITGATYQADWNSLYIGGLKDLREIDVRAQQDDLAGYQGISKVLSAYIYHQLVDYFGDIPYTEALQGETILAPAFEDDAAIYDALLISLDEAIVLLDTAILRDELVQGDLMYSADFANWIAAANTLKLKMLLNISNVDPARAATGINAILADGRLINKIDGSEDWQLAFNTTQVPDNRHQFYNSQYDQGPGHIDNHIMLEMVIDEDPRIRYYFYRQAEYDDLDFQTTPCNARSDCDTWEALFATGTNYIGRDHGDPNGLPADDALVTVPGVYPIGGKFDNSSFNPVNQNGTESVNGAQGAGIMPLFTASMTHFMLAESSLNIPSVTTPLTAEEHFEAGMVASFSKVRAFSMGTSEVEFIQQFEADTTEATNDNDSRLYQDLVDTYIIGKMSDFQAAGSDADRLELVMRQKNRAQWGNGMESYTDLRRTGRPNNFPGSLAPTASFPRRVLYPDSEIAGNPNAPDEVIPQSTPIFWDN